MQIKSESLYYGLEVRPNMFNAELTMCECRSVGGYIYAVNQDVLIAKSRFIKKLKYYFVSAV